MFILTEHDSRVTTVDENATREVAFPLALWHFGSLALHFQIKILQAVHSSGKK